jgi:hypothetical protein
MWNRSDWFGDNSPSYHCPGNSFVSRRICYALFKRCGNLDQDRRMQVFADAYADLWQRYDKIIHSFKTGKCKGNEANMTRSNLTGFLHTTIMRTVMRLSKAQTKVWEKEEGPVEVEAEYRETADGERDQIVKSWCQDAFKALTDDEKHVVRSRLMRGDNLADLARRQGMTAARCSKLVYRAKLKFRSAVIRSAVAQRLAGRAGLGERFGSVIATRCKMCKDCYMYRRLCPVAHLVPVIAAMEFDPPGVAAVRAYVKECAKEKATIDVPAGLTEQFPDISAASLSGRSAVVETKLSELAEMVVTVLDDWSLPAAELDQCQWAEHE